jgi:CheY-like chemotaxis protein/nitrogen-specific signal transduction histidine kinase
VVIRDVTARRDAEHGWQRARDAALTRSRLKSQFVATMSHEIRTPITGVIGLTDLLLTTELDEVQRRYVDGVRVSGEALMAVINDVLDFSKIEEGKFRLDEVDFDLGMLLDEVVTITAHSAASKGLHVQVDRDPDLPLGLRGDPGRIRQILLNLVNNAVKFTDEGGVAIRARPCGASGVGDRVLVQLEVADTGVGIDPDKLQELFEPFVQADASTTRTRGGTGLGLTICRQLAEAMGGGVEADSRLGEGTTLRVVLPLRRALADLSAGRASRASVAARPRRRGTSDRPGRILVVEDNEISQAVVVGALSAAGYAVDVAADGVEALQWADAGEYQAILMDCHMPRMDGFTAAEELRRRPATAQTPILAMTADVLKEQRDRCLASGMDDFIPKPIRPHELRAALAGWTGYGSADPVAPAAPPAAPPALDPVRERITEILGDRTPSEVALVMGMVTSFPAKAERLVQDMVAAADRGDDDAALHAHSLKGAAANLGATLLTAICEDLERAGALQDVAADHRAAAAAARGAGVLRGRPAGRPPQDPGAGRRRPGLRGLGAGRGQVLKGRRRRRSPSCSSRAHLLTVTVTGIVNVVPWQEFGEVASMVTASVRMNVWVVFAAIVGLARSVLSSQDTPLGLHPFEATTL